MGFFGAGGSVVVGVGVDGLPVVLELGFGLFTDGGEDVFPGFALGFERDDFFVVGFAVGFLVAC